MRSSDNLKGSGSCGCLSAEATARRNLSHGASIGGSLTPEYQSYAKAIERCESPACPAHVNYGARGIYMCRRWRNDFASFRADMGPRPSREHSLDRIDVNGSYTCGRADLCDDCRERGAPANCRWADRLTQARNRRTTVVITHDGETRPLVEWAERSGVTPTCLRQRLARGISVADALSAPPRHGPIPKRQGVSDSSIASAYASSELW